MDKNNLKIRLLIRRLIKENLHNNNIILSKYGHITINEPLIPDAVQLLSNDKRAIKFTNKNEFDAFAQQQKYFSASASHCFYSKEEYDAWSRNGSKYSDPDSKNSVMVFETGRELVEIWDAKNNIGFIIPSDSLR